MNGEKYVLITAARNEEAYLPIAAGAVLSQTVLPMRWIIVNNGSTDRTDEIAQGYADRHPFIHLLRQEKKSGTADFASKVSALAAGCEQTKDMDYRFIGHLDADVSFGPDYYEKVLDCFARNPRLGLAGGFIYERHKGSFQSRPFNTSRSVAGAVQLFRRSCYEAIGHIVPFTMGGEDAYAEAMARRIGWEVRSFPELRVFHNRKGTVARGIFREGFQSGRMDYALGNHPVFETFKVIRRVRERPYILAALLRMSGFTWSCIRKTNRPVADEFVSYVRWEQINLLKTGLLRTLQGKVSE